MNKIQLLNVSYGKMKIIIKKAGKQDLADLIDMWKKYENKKK